MVGSCRKLVEASGYARVLLLGIGAASTFLAACTNTASSTGEPGEIDTRPPRPTDLEHAADPNATANAADSSNIIESFAQEPTPTRRTVGPEGDIGANTPANIEAIAQVGPAASGPAPEADAPAQADEQPATDINTQITAKSAELRTMLAQRAIAAGNPLAATLALAAFDAATETHAAPDKNLILSPTEQRIASAARDVFTGLTRGPGITGDPVKTADVLEDAARLLSKDAGIRIAYAGLCRRVDSFGRFEPFVNSAFLAGRAHRAIVYVELDQFATRSPGSSDAQTVDGAQWVVEVSQELELIHDADGRQQWYRPAQTVTDASRTQRRDFYLVNTIDLPATLSVGAYSLKVTIRDRTSSAADERIIPLQIIADASALQSPRSISASK